MPIPTTRIVEGVIDQPTGLRILITNRSLMERGGSETYVRDVAECLLRRGHTPVVYSTRLGAAAADLRGAGIPVVDRLEALGAAPDIIHGQHHIETMTALFHFPRVPAVFVCHGWLPWEEAPPRFPRVLRYVAVNVACHDRLLLEHGIAEARIRTILNAVDLGRFRPRDPLPERPRRALVLSNEISDATSLGALRDACARHAIVLEVVGREAGTSTKHPEEALRRADLVFAMGRSAIEAMAVGASVIVCGAFKSGPLVTSGNLEALRPLNFGIRTAREPIDADSLAKKIDAYDAADAARVADKIRSTAGRDVMVDALLDVYAEVLAEFSGTVRDDGPTAEFRAAADYLRFLSAPLADHVHLEIANRRREDELRRERKRSRLRRWMGTGPTGS